MLLKILFLTLIIALIIFLLWKMRRYLGRLVLILLFLGIVFLIYKGINPQNAQQFQTQIHHHLSSSWQQLSTWITDETTPQLSDTIASTHEDNSTAQTQFSRFAQFFASESSSTETSEYADISHSESESASPEINDDPTLILSDHNGQKDQKLILEDDPFASREMSVINELPTEQAIITL
ncbi:MAG: hypothetical protein Q4B28_05445 [bacterium]|nr:hypothetical protein [bacterium]